MVAENSKRLALLGQSGEDAADVGQEAHVKHLVGFVQHQDFDSNSSSPRRWPIRSSRRPGQATTISTPSRRPLHLREGADAAVNGQAAQAGLASQGVDGGMGLFGQLAGGRKDQGAQLAARSAAAGAAGWVRQRRLFSRFRFGQAQARPALQEWAEWCGVGWRWGWNSQRLRSPR